MAQRCQGAKSRSLAGRTERCGIVVLKVPSRRLSVVGAKQKLTYTANDCRRVMQDVDQKDALALCVECLLEIGLVACQEMQW